MHSYVHTNMFYSSSQLIQIYLSKIFHFNKLRSVIGIKMSQQWEVPILSVCLISSSPCVPPKQTQFDKKFRFFVYIDFPRSRGKGDSRPSVDIPVYIRTFFCLFCVNLALSSQQTDHIRQTGPPPLYTTVLDHVCLTSVIVSVMLHNGGVCDSCITKLCLYTYNSKNVSYNDLVSRLLCDNRGK